MRACCQQVGLVAVAASIACIDTFPPGAEPQASSSSSAHGSSADLSSATATDTTRGDDTPSSTAASNADSGESSASGVTASSSSTGDDTGELCVDDHRVIAYLANWEACPTAEQLAQYSHVVLAFAVSYTWTPDGVICSETCELTPVDGCVGTPLAQLVSDLHAADVEVVISFGGASMGGIWEGTCGEMTRCWDHCIDQVEAVVGQLTDIVGDSDADGIDIDYEYCLHDEAHRSFVAELTTGLRAALDAAFPGDHKLVTHAPMDSELEVGDAYYDILVETAGAIDFIMPQYYNGGRSPFTPEGLDAIHTHYSALVDGIFDGDASRVVFGYCIEPGCNPVATQPEALGVTEMFDAWYPDNGGVFFWAHPYDTDAWFSAPFRTHYDADVCMP